MIWCIIYFYLVTYLTTKMKQLFYYTKIEAKSGERKPPKKYPYFYYRIRDFLLYDSDVHREG